MTIQQRRNSQRLVTMVVGVALTVAGAVIGSSGSASAHHPLIDASVTCNHVVNWTASAWLPPDEGDVSLHRTNSQIDVTYTVEGYGPVVAVATGAFNSGNGFSFGGQFTYPDGADKILLTAKAIVAWGNGSPGGDSWSVWVYKPGVCQETTTTLAEETTTTVGEETTTTVGESATTIVNETTTTVGESATTIVNETTTTLVDSGGPTTTVSGPTTTLVSSGGPTTTVGSSGGNLPRTGQSTASMLMMAFGIMLIGASIVLSTRRRLA